MSARWDWGVVAQVLPHLIEGLVVTLQAVAGGTAIALVLGMVWALLRRSSRRWLTAPVGLLVELVRSTPLLVQLYFFYYSVLPALGLAGQPLVTGVVALGVHYSTYTSEVYRSGIDGIARGQWEAAWALGLTRWQAYRHVILPQAVPPVIPVLGNYVIAMFKDSPLLAAIAVVEVLTRALSFGAEHFRYLEPLTMVGVLYLVMSSLSGRATRWLELRYAVTKE
ncbi:MAG TPA: ectoine/hydroxyectoine ABC transporter permease subunit EhuD [Sandaracinaceae bacterium LLY-WYZ-13_1]|nr:ectoine/hydroxyectoine ABC transporter permease subunit EhuD [Sandaracinaceae bacterium LLY-WYZ-13_1]